MAENKKPARCANTEQANIKQMQCHFTESAKHGKLKFVRLTVWLRMPGG